MQQRQQQQLANLHACAWATAGKQLLHLFMLA
jgi:hypothetical protein